mgnify:CR=1 FL=1
MDGTFNSCPRSFYQIFNILGLCPNKKKAFPIISFLITSKSEKIYEYVFIEFKKLIKSLNMKIDFKNIKIMADFERALRNAIHKNFLDSELMGCYFHYVKNLYSYLKKIGLCKNNIIKQTIKFLFFFKVFPFIQDNNKKNYLKEITNYYINDNPLNNKYYKFIKYFINNWYGTKIMSFESLSNEDIIFRTDNLIDNFHRKLNSFIDCHKPKISYFVYKYKNLIINMYKFYIESLIDINREQRDKFSISEDIIEFLKNLKIETIDFKGILQLNEKVMIYFILFVQKYLV